MVLIFLLLTVALVGVDYLERTIKQAPVSASGSRGGVRSLSPADRLRLATDRVLSDFGIWVDWIEVKGNERRVRVPAEIHPIEIYQALSAQVRRLGGKTLRGKEDLRTGETELTYSLSDHVLGSIRLIPDPTISRRLGSIALIIDDFGYANDELISKFLDLSFPVTYAIIPGTPYSEEIARQLDRTGKSMIIHMPMEALEKKVERNGFELLLSMGPEEIRRRVHKALRLFPMAEGMNNHMGSRATLDESFLNIVLSELKPAGLYFIDSHTNNNTRGYHVAQNLGLPCGINDTFLDSIDDLEHIEQKLWYLADLAAERGMAIGIGHPYPATLDGLREVVPKLQRRGFEFVSVGHVTHRTAADSLSLAQRPNIRRN